jgi:hypothetical protein
MLGSLCRGAGVWIADQSLRGLTRIDGDQLATPAKLPATSPDGRRVALVWNNQLWTLTLDEISAGVSMPVKSLLLVRPGDERSAAMRELRSIGSVRCPGTRTDAERLSASKQEGEALGFALVSLGWRRAVLARRNLVLLGRSGREELRSCRV